MAPTPSTGDIKYVIVRSYGGEPASSAVLAPKLGPLGVPPKKAGDEMVKVTQPWKGVRVTVRLAIENRQVSAEVIPTSTSMILKALNEPIRDRKKVKNITHSGNLSLDVIIDIARKMRTCGHGIPSRTLKGSILEILGTANSVGCTVDGMKPSALQKLIKNDEVIVPEL